MKKILLADDNKELCSALCLMLETRLGYETITEARDMEHVLAQVEDSPPCCIILDWELPGRPTREHGVMIPLRQTVFSIYPFALDCFTVRRPVPF